MVAGGLPTVTVSLDDGTGTFPIDITSRGRLVEGVTGGRGRGDELAQTAPAQIAVVLENTDGALTLGSTILGSPSPIVVDQEVRIKFTVGATTVNRYTGNLAAAPVSFPNGDDQYVLVKATLMDPGAIASRWPLLSAAETLIVASGPSAYYPMDEPSTSVTCADRSGKQMPALALVGTGAAPTFGDKLANTELGAVKFAGGEYLYASGLPGSTDWTCLHTFVSTSNVVVTLGSTPLGFSITLSSGFSGRLGVFPGFATGTPNQYNDGNPHVVMQSCAAGTVSVYVDGALAGTYGGGASSSGFATAAGSGADGTSTPFNGDVGQIAFWTSALNASQIADISEAILVGYQAERTDQRLSRLATLIGVPTGTLDTGLTVLPATDPGGQQASDAINDVAAAEYGSAYFDGSGNLTFHNRNRGPLKTSPDVTVDANFLDEGTEFQVDMLGACNYFEATAQATGVKQIVRDIVSEQGDGTAAHPRHGRYPLSQTWLVLTDAEALDRANWIVQTRSQPVQRAGTLKVDLMTMIQADQQAWLAVEPDHWIRITGLPAQTPGGTTADFVVEGWSEVMNAGEWSLTLNVVTRAFFTAWILGDSTFSVLGSTTRLYI